MLFSWLSWLWIQFLSCKNQHKHLGWIYLLVVNHSVLLPQLQQTRLVANKHKVGSLREAQRWDGAFQVRRSVCAPVTENVCQLPEWLFKSSRCTVKRCTSSPGPASQGTVFRHSEEFWDFSFLDDAVNGAAVTQEGAEVFNLENGAALNLRKCLKLESSSETDGSIQKYR